MQKNGLRVISFRHEQNAGYAASIAGFLTQKPGICLTVSAPGFLNGLTALANATTNCFPMILISGSSEREIVDLQQGDYEEMDQLAIAKPLCKAAFRVLNAEDIGVGIARAIRAAPSAGEVVAVAAGKVIYEGGAMRGYGNMLIIKHANNYLSAYAHNKVNLVKEGQSVSKGQKIAEMGNSDSDVVKLHFEIRQAGKPIDPMKVLPAR